MGGRHGGADRRSPLRLLINGRARRVRGSAQTRPRTAEQLSESGFPSSDGQSIEMADVEATRATAPCGVAEASRRRRLASCAEPPGTAGAAGLHGEPQMEQDRDSLITLTFDLISPSRPPSASACDQHHRVRPVIVSLPRRRARFTSSGSCPPPSDRSGFARPLRLFPRHPFLPPFRLRPGNTLGEGPQAGPFRAGGESSLNRKFLEPSCASVDCVVGYRQLQTNTPTRRTPNRMGRASAPPGFVYLRHRLADDVNQPGLLSVGASREGGMKPASIHSYLSFPPLVPGPAASKRGMDGRRDAEKGEGGEMLNGRCTTTHDGSIWVCKVQDCIRKRKFQNVLDLWPSARSSRTRTRDRGR